MELSMIKGSDDAYYSDRKAAERIGERIRAIRKTKGLTQKELGELIDVSSDQIQKYENGAHKPRLVVMKKLSGALNVNSLAIADPTPGDCLNSLFTLFELEKRHNMQMEKVGNNISFTFNDDDFNKYINIWCDKKAEVQAAFELASTDEQKEQIINEYNEWKWDFPLSVNQNKKSSRKYQIIKEMQRLKEEFSKLNKKR